jgi:xanthine dehydrogenase accessory factor
MRELFAELNQVLANGRACVWCELIETRGSTPQKAGAAMLVFPDGRQFGTLGGGCVEAEVKQRALRVLAEGSAEPGILTFNLDSNYGWDDGLICGGRMLVLADPLPEPGSEASPRRQQAMQYYGTWQRLIEQGTGCTEAVVMHADAAGLPAGSRYLFDQGGGLVAQLADGGPSKALRQSLQPVQRRPKAYAALGVAYLPIWPRVTVVLVGAGHVGQAVAKLAADCDFDIWVLDDRAAYASAERFPSAGRRLVGDIGTTLTQLAREEITPSHFCLIATRGHNHDEEALFHLAGSNAGYVGMIGSKRKIKLIYEDLIARGISRAALERVHAPLGLAIGSQTVPEIAVSIVAELIACRNLGASIPAAREQVRL